MRRLHACSSFVLAIAGCGDATATRLESGAESLEAHVACTPDTKDTILTQAAAAPLSPPMSLVGIDLSLGGTWAPVARTFIEERFCAGLPAAVPEDSPVERFVWGSEANGNYLSMDFDKKTHALHSWQLAPGSEGWFRFRSRPGSPFGDAEYSVRVGYPILRKGRPFHIDWSDRTAIERVATEIHDAVIATQAPELAPEQTNCAASGRCLVHQDAEKIIIGIRDVRFYIAMWRSNDHPEWGPTASYFYGFHERPQIHPPPRAAAVDERGRQL